ncbi:pantoate--beta-alanine ligase [Paenibacillus chungangensis]|uniref:Pantothenate synthetase n=1 Tax=Paenibacillus chungangensis TaxID=696535 RepID=A0ABW3HN19_9BACL
MIIVRTKEELRHAIREMADDGQSIGLVPTMGYLHEGHASLLTAAREQCEVTVLSIFVNPLQFGANEDLDTYPRDETRDIALAGSCHTDIVFIPSVQEMYSSRPLTSVKVSEITEQLCGASRPGHFDGVGIVIAKLFHLVKPHRAYFGMKDAQQVAVIEQLVHDLDFDVEIVRMPTVREPDGLALSSRNVRLSPEQRHQALVLSKVLKDAARWLKGPEMTVDSLLKAVRTEIGKMKEAEIDYVELMQYPSLQRVPGKQCLQEASGTVILALAVKFGATRLIDNALYTIGER